MSQNEVFSTARAEEVIKALTENGAKIADSAAGRLIQKVARVVYDYNEHGGAIGDIDLGVSLPAKAIVTRAYYDVITTLTSATDAATIALKLASANDVKSAVAISNGSNHWDAGLHDAIQSGAASAMLKLSAEKSLIMSIAVEAVTAGKMVIFLEYAVSA